MNFFHLELQWNDCSFKNAPLREERPSLYSSTLSWSVKAGPVEQQFLTPTPVNT